MALSGSVVPFATDEFAGVTAIETSFAAPTVRFVEPAIAPEVAVIDAVPAATPVASPAALMVAVVGDEELQFTLEVRFGVLPSE